MSALQAVIVPDISTKNLIVRKIRAEWKEELTVLQTRKSTIPPQPHHHMGPEVRMAAVTTKPRPTTGTTNRRFKSQLCGHVEIGQSMSAPLENSIITTPGQGCPSGRSPTIGTTRKCPEVTKGTEVIVKKILWQGISTAVIEEVQEETEHPNTRAVWNLILAYIMRNQTNIISFKSSRTVNARPRLKVGPLKRPARTDTTKSLALLLIIVLVRTESAEIVITGPRTVNMVLR